MLLTENPAWPKIAASWDYARNAVKPTELYTSSHRKVWWKCTEGHERLATALSMIEARGGTCLTCKKLPYSHPHLMEEWDYTRNTIEPITVGSGHGKVWWLCSKKHSYEMAVHNRIKRPGCPFCSGQKVLQGFNDLASLFPDTLSFYSSQNKKPPEASYANDKTVFLWECSLGHVYSSSAKLQQVRNACAICINERYLPGFNPVAITHPDVLAEWREDNIHSPHELFWKSAEFINWRCSSCGHSFRAKLQRRAEKSTSCAVCVGQVIRAGVNDLATFGAKLLAEFDYENNRKTPQEVGKGTPVYWLCPKGHSYQATPTSKLKGFGFCDTCKPYLHRSAPEQRLLDAVKNLLLQQDLLVLSNDRSAIKPYELDIFIPKLKKAIEFNGDYWHSDKVVRRRGYGSADEYHRMKLDLAREKDIELLFVWEDDWRTREREVLLLVKDFLCDKISITTDMYSTHTLLRGKKP